MKRETGIANRGTGERRAESGDALTKQRTDGALVRVITPVYKSETLQDAEARLQGFVREIVPVLDEYIPGK